MESTENNTVPNQTGTLDTYGEELARMKKDRDELAHRSDQLKREINRFRKEAVRANQNFHEGRLPCRSDDSSGEIRTGEKRV